MKTTRYFLLACMLLIFALQADAQKLPNKQGKSIRAPADVKIDGKTNEWNNEFQAFNSNNRIYYTVANDDDNLYLVLRTSEGVSNEKALFGITFTINLPSENGKKSKDNITIMFPTVVAGKRVDPIRNATQIARRLKNDTTYTARKKKDSLMLFANKAISDSYKEIDVTGIKELPDHTISIYNTNGLKVAAQFDELMQYTYELSVPLKYLGIKINLGQRFSYNIKMNGMPLKSPGSPYPSPIIMPDGANFMDPDVSFVMFPTDFWGEYTLAKKP